MRKMLLAASLCALAASPPLAAQTAPTATAPAAAAAAPITARPALWRIADEDTTIYLFGTIHFLKPGVDWLNGEVKAAFERSDTLVLELVQPEPAAMQALVMRLATAPAGPTLTERLPADRRPAYAAALAGAGVQPAALDRLDPWFAAMSLSLVTVMRAGYDPQNGPETVLAAAAAAARKPVVGLETAEAQLGLLDTLPERAQLSFLMQAVEQLPQATRIMDAMLQSWVAGDPAKLATMLNEGMTADPVIFERLLTQRNRRWATWTEERLRTPGTVFVAVGAGHLAGDASLLAMLNKDGVTVTRVR